MDKIEIFEELQRYKEGSREAKTREIAVYSHFEYGSPF